VTGGAGTDNFFINNFANEASGGPTGSGNNFNLRSTVVEVLIRLS
jgi:hypothetical protein